MYKYQMGKKQYHRLNKFILLNNLEFNKFIIYHLSLKKQNHLQKIILEICEPNWLQQTGK